MKTVKYYVGNYIDDNANFLSNIVWDQNNNRLQESIWEIISKINKQGGFLSGVDSINNNFSIYYFTLN